MKTFATYDYYIQLIILIIGCVLVLLDIMIFKNLISLFFYFIVGIPQLISFCIKAFMNIKTSFKYIIYGIGILPVWISWGVIWGFHDNHYVTNIVGVIIISSVIYSPILAIIYVCDAYNFYKLQK